MLWNLEEVCAALARRIRELRLERAWTQSEIAGRAGISPATYQHFERTGKISLERLTRVAVALGRAGEIERLFEPAPIRSLDELASPKTGRKRGRRKP